MDRARAEGVCVCVERGFRAEEYVTALFFSNYYTVMFSTDVLLFLVCMFVYPTQSYWYL